jgi:tRNA pseudouridine55 synthase
MDGLLIIDKPAGPTSHDVVARMRRALREPRIGHTGTLDPAATGVLPLVVGRATRLARFLSASDKEYEAVIRLGVRTDTWDAEGVPVSTLSTTEGRTEVGPASDAAQTFLPSRDVIEAALDAFRGSFLQQPPAFSAKKVAGQRSYRLARANRRRQRAHESGPGSDQDSTSKDSTTSEPGAAAVAPAPAAAPVTVHALTLVTADADRVMLRVHCSAGFYVRALAHDLGERLGTGAHLAELRRTRVGDYAAADAITLADAERDPESAVRRLVPLGRLLPGLSSVVLTTDGVRHATHGRNLGPADLIGGRVSDSVQGSALGSASGSGPSGSIVRLLDGSGDLVGLAEPTPTPGLLHPSVVLV